MTDVAFNEAGLRRLHDDMTQLVANGDRPGIVALAARGPEVHVNAIGTHEFGGGRSMRRDTIFRIASTTKSMVAATALSFVSDQPRPFRWRSSKA
jgi:CubicO group peptidase (beta-lactamase class C family)